MNQCSTVICALLFAGVFRAGPSGWRDSVQAAKTPDEYGPYNVYTNIKLLETGRWTPCLQCFAVPCIEGERMLRPLDEWNLCCRFCRVRKPGEKCAAFRTEEAVVCPKDQFCRISTRDSPGRRRRTNSSPIASAVSNRAAVLTTETRHLNSKWQKVAHYDAASPQTELDAFAVDERANERRSQRNNQQAEAEFAPSRFAPKMNAPLLIGRNQGQARL
ncbi:uncharacterized protein LOC144109949 [Amblyomma americanum]